MCIMRHTSGLEMNSVDFAISLIFDIKREVTVVQSHLKRNKHICSFATLFYILYYLKKQWIFIYVIIDILNIFYCVIAMVFLIHSILLEITKNTKYLLMLSYWHTVLYSFYKYYNTFIPLTILSQTVKNTKYSFLKLC